MKININESPTYEEKERKEENNNFYILKYESNGEHKEINIEPLISISNKGIQSLSLEEIDEALEKTSAYRFSISSLKEDIGEQLIVIKSNLDQWIGNNWDFVTDIALTRRSIKKEKLHVPNSWFSSITKEEIKGIFLSNPKINEMYLKLNKDLRKYQKTYNKLSDLLKILEDRGSQLQSILKSKQMRVFKA